MCLGVCISIETLAEAPSRTCKRQAMCGMPVETQKALYRKDFSHCSVTNLIQNNFDLLCGKMESDAVLYLAVHAKSKTWYIGRTTCGRQRAQHVWHGPAVRWREHFHDSFTRTSGTKARRYKAWQKFAPSFLSFIAIQCGDRKVIEHLETQAIRTLQPPTQCTPCGCGSSTKQRPTKSWTRPDRFSTPAGNANLISGIETNQ